MSIEAPETVTASRFAIIVDGAEIASFEQLQRFDEPQHPAAAASGKAQAPVIVLRRGPHSRLLQDWHDAGRRGNILRTRRSCTLAMFDAEGGRVAHYRLTQAWPSRLQPSTAQPGHFEAVTITYDELRRLPD
jgi:hypothetical protein